MALKYTTTDAIGLRLTGRLLVDSSPSAFGQTEVNSDLIDQVGAQVEARVDAEIRKVYEFPLRTNSQPLLASIVEKLTICEIIGTYFYGKAESDDGGYGKLMCSQGMAELMAIGAGEVVLDGELPRSSPVNFSSSFSRAQLRNPGIAEGVNW